MKELDQINNISKMIIIDSIDIINQYQTLIPEGSLSSILVYMSFKLYQNSIHFNFKVIESHDSDRLGTSPRTREKMPPAASPAFSQLFYSIWPAKKLA